MQLSKFSDYSFRALIYLGSKKDTQCTVDELATELNASTHHMKKVVHKLANLGYIQSQKGRNGGLRLGMEPKDINLGTVLQSTEENLSLMDCFSQQACPLLSYGCSLKQIATEALDAFIQKFSSHTLQDLL